MLGALTLAAALEGVSANFAPALDALFEKHHEEGVGEPFISAQAEADLNGDEILDGVVIFSYRIGPSMDRSHSQYLTLVTSSPTGFATSSPVLVGTRGARYIHSVEIKDSEIILYADLTVWDGTASMADLPATGEIHYRYLDGALREQGGTWKRKP